MTEPRTDDDFRTHPDPKEQMRLAAAGVLKVGYGTTPARKSEPPMAIAAESTEPPPRKRQMNKTEAAYAETLEVRKLRGEITWYGYEAVTLKLADDCRYTPDFTVVTASGGIEFHEAKGFWRDDARVKIKVAAAQFPWARFCAVRKPRKADGLGWVREWF